MSNEDVTIRSHAGLRFGPLRMLREALCDLHFYRAQDRNQIVFEMRDEGT